MEMQEALSELNDSVNEYTVAHKRRQALQMYRRDYVKNALGYKPQMPEEMREEYGQRTDTLIESILSGETPGEDVPDQVPAIVRNLEVMAEEAIAREKLCKQFWEKIAEQLPVWEYANGIRALSSRGLGLIVGVSAGVTPEDKEAGLDRVRGLERFATPAKLWSWWALSVEDGSRPKAGPNGRKGYGWGMVADPLQKNGDGYKRFYYARRAHTAKTHPEWRPGHSHNDAMMVMFKKLLKYIWIAWQDPQTAKHIESEAMYGEYDAIDHR